MVYACFEINTFQFDDKNLVLGSVACGQSYSTKKLALKV